MINASSSTENQFQTHLDIEKVNLSRTMCLYGVLLYMVFAFVDYFALSATLVNIILVRGFIIVVLFSVFAYSHHESFIKQYDLLFLAVYVLAAVGTEAMIYLASPSDHASNVYLAGLLLVIMTIFTWSYLKIWNALLAAMIIITSYALLGLYKQLVVIDVVINVIFLVSATGIGFMSQLLRDRYLRDNFFLQQSLKDSVEEKTVEANHDGLTGLANRRYVKTLLAKLLDEAKQEKDKILVVMFIDLDGFKQINDEYGHAVGDKVLVIVARRLELAIRIDDSVARLGGDEYVIGLLMKKDKHLKIKKITEKFTKVISDPMRIDGLKLNISASVGVAIYPEHGESVGELIDSADKKMYLKKYEENEKASESSEANTSKVIARKSFIGNTLTIVR